MGTLSLLRKTDANNAGIPRARATVYDSAGVLPTSGNTQGDQAFLPGDSSTDLMYIWDGGGWYKIALIQTVPSFTTGPEASYSLAADQSTTVITLVATDPEGIAVTYSATTDVGFDSLGTVSQDSSVFTITPMSSDSAQTTSGTITFKATDGISIASAISTFTLQFTIVKSGFTTALVKATGNTGTNATFTDGSSSSHSVTTNGTARSTSFTPFHPGGYSSYFDGSTHKADVAASGNFSIGTGAFTLEAWVTCESKGTDTYYRRIFSLDGPSGNSNGNLQMTINPTTGSMDMWSNSSDLDLTGTIPIDDGEWHHVAIVRSGTTITSYVDGKLNRSGTYSAAIGTHNSSQPRPRVGSYDGSSGDFHGAINEVRLVVGTAVYTTTFIPPTEKLTAVTNTKLLLQHNPILIDNSGSSHAVTENGTQHRRTSPYDHGAWNLSDHGSSMYIDGNGDYLSHNDIGMDGLNDFTVEAWVYPQTGFKSYANSLYGSGPSANLASTFVYYGWSSDGTAHMFSNKANNSTAAVAGSTGDIVLNQWQHVAFVRTSNNASIYVNGTKVAGPTSMTGTMAAAPSGRAYIGTQSYAEGDVNRTIDGYISDFRIHNTCLYSSNFTAPTAKLTATSGTQYLMAASPSIYDNAGKANELLLVGNTQSSTATKKYAPSSMDFDGTGDYITFNVDGGLGAKDFTLEAWVYQDTLSNYQSWFSSTRGSTGFNCGTDADGDFVWYDQVSSSARKIEGASALSATTWYHVAFVRNSGVLTGYLSGALKGSPYTQTADFSAEAFAIGTTVGALTETMDGHIEDFRLTKGLARYPFIPAKETLTTTNSQRSGVTVTASNVTLLTCHAATIVDGSSNGTSITTNGNAAVSDFGPGTGMKSVKFDGTGDYLQCTLADTLGTNDWTIEYWVYHNNTSSNQIHCAFNGYAPAFYYRNSSDAFTVYHNGGISSPYYNPNITPEAHKWYHLAWVCDTSANTVSVFVNGSFIEDVTYTGNINGTTFRIGDDGTSAWMDGYISNLRIVKDTTVYSKTFTPPAAALDG